MRIVAKRYYITEAYFGRQRRRRRKTKPVTSKGESYIPKVDTSLFVRIKGTEPLEMFRPKEIYL